MNMMKVEVCVDSLLSATNAVYNGADELEVCSNLLVGGLTPSFDLVKKIQQMINKYMESPPHPIVERPKVNVMIRCNANGDFCYSEEDVELMVSDIKRFKELNVDRFVFGAFTNKKYGTPYVDSDACLAILSAADPQPVTFHRAFDTSPDPYNSVKDIVNLGFSRLLTSGQRASADDVRAVDMIRVLMLLHGHEIEIMPGGGINIDNVDIFINLGCKMIHGTFKQNKNDDKFIITDGRIVKEIKKIIEEHSKWSVK